VHVVAVGGRIDVSAEALRDAGIRAAAGADDLASSVDAALAEPARWVQAAAERLVTTWTDRAGRWHGRR
jgi:hypothetical protein